ncbi:MAG: RDD family protein [Candidatus Hydrogenedentes bacterium]|nr:RDD family protein [Candidatus Hydrogenedentota bacterium]
MSASLGGHGGYNGLRAKVVRPTGEGIGYLRTFGRPCAVVLSAIILLIGYIIAAFDEEKRALHHRICDTRAVCAS